MKTENKNSIKNTKIKQQTNAVAINTDEDWQNQTKNLFTKTLGTRDGLALLKILTEN